MINGELYFKWRSQGPNHRPHVNYDWMIELLLHTMMLDNEMLRHMSGAILSKIYGAALIMMHAQLLIVMPDWMPFQYQHAGHNFETGMDGMRFMAPALVAALGSDPEKEKECRGTCAGVKI